MQTEQISYQKAANKFVKSYYEIDNSERHFYIYRYIRILVGEAKKIAKSIGLIDQEYQNTMVATWFRYVGISDITSAVSTERTVLLHKFFDEVDYPVDQRRVVEEAILNASEENFATDKIQQVVSDAIFSKLSFPSILENIILIKNEINNIANTNLSELYFIKHSMNEFIKSRYYTEFAFTKYSANRQKNFLLLEKRAHKLEAEIKEEEAQESAGLSNKATEDIFKLAFRNYNHLISVADAKAGLLINVNSIIISVMLGFVISKIETKMYLLPPTLLLLTISLTTILLSVLASRPQGNFYSEKNDPACSQKFFFGSFDLIDPKFGNISWGTYQERLSSFFNGSRETVLNEVFKESFNVRKVLVKKFTYLSIAFRVFIIGLLLSIIAFVVSIQFQIAA